MGGGGGQLGDGVCGGGKEKEVRTLGSVHVVRARGWEFGHLSSSA